jgi:alcohol dehydrogenase, propanol-preferring
VGGEPGGAAPADGAQHARRLGRHLQADAPAVLARAGARNVARRLEAIDVARHGRRRHAFARRKLADADTGVLLDEEQEGGLPARQSERVRLAAELAVELEEHGSQPVGYINWAQDLKIVNHVTGSQYTVNYVNDRKICVMHAQVLDRPGTPLEYRDVPQPRPRPGEVLLRVHACGVCRTDLHIVDGELDRPKLPLIPGHQIVGTIEATGERVGVPWLAWTCGECRYCVSGRENLCELAKFTGYDVDGGYAEWAVADERFCFPLPDGYPDLQAAPLLCAGLIGYRALRLAGDAPRLGLYGFGAAAHIVAQVARHEGRRVFALTRPGDDGAQSLARELGAEWAGDTVTGPPEELDAAIIFAPAGELVPVALEAVARGGTVVCAGIHMSDIPSFPYELLWEERVLRSVANLTRRDAEEFLELAPRIPVETHVEVHPLEAANEALARLRAGRIRGAAVLQVA